MKKNIDNDKLYEVLPATKEKLRLDLDIQYFSVDDLLNEYVLFLRVYKLKDEFRYLIKRDSEKKTVLRELFSCNVEKFNGFNIVRVEFWKNLREFFHPIDIIYKPVKNMMK